MSAPPRAGIDEPAAAPDRPITAWLRYPGKPATAVELEVVARTPRERTVRAAKSWVFCWLAAIAAVFIPLLHFVLVPALLIAGPLIARARWQERLTLRRMRGPCPGCAQVFEDLLDRPLIAEIAWRCVACGRALTLSIDLASLAPHSTGVRA